MDLYQMAGTSCKAEATANNKLRKETWNLQRKKKQPSFGICFDCDGVLARGTMPIEAAKRAFEKLCDTKGDLFVPVTFVTNCLNRNMDKAHQLAEWFETQISTDQMVQAQGPLEMFTRFHDKFCLIVGQGKVFDIARDLGFTNMCTVEDIADAYPLLDMVDHDNRERVAEHGYTEKTIPRVEAVILMGEPKRWESSLQLVIDLLKTDGKPDHLPATMPDKHLPILACNMDLEFMDRAAIPRFGHGAFLLCLEALYKKITGNELKYTALIGKPSEITFRFAEECLSREAHKLGIEEPLKTMYLIGDCPDVDIVGSNLYQRYLDRLKIRENNHHDTSDKESHVDDLFDPDIPKSRNVPLTAHFHEQTVETVTSILVCTGVYKPDAETEPGKDEEGEKIYEGHRDFPKVMELLHPTLILEDVEAAIDYILEHEQSGP